MEAFMGKDKENLEIAKRYLDSVREAKLNAIAIACRVKELKTTSKKLIAVYQMESVAEVIKKWTYQIMLLRLMKKLLNN
jgi:hypothetical protein